MAVTSITVFTRNDCAACKGTKAYFDTLGLEYLEINIEEERHMGVAQRLVDDGWRSMPVVRVTYDEGEDEFWAGTKQDHMRAVARGERPVSG